MGFIFGILLAFASKVFFVKEDERKEKMIGFLPGANCGGCGYAGCSALAAAIVEGKASTNACCASNDETSKKIAEIIGVKAESSVRYRAQVMCSGTCDVAKKKYEYDGIDDCIAANKLCGGEKMCPYGCIGHGTCTRACKFDAIHVIDGIATVDYSKCTGCGACVASCPKQIIKLIPYDAKYWVGCMSAVKGANAMKYCSRACIGCKKCEKGCPTGAITCNGFLASIKYEACIDCGECVKNCPRKIIMSSETNRVEIAKNTENKD
jgi:RnfABCDGE-type electron transport complex B subunit